MLLQCQTTVCSSCCLPSCLLKGEQKDSRHFVERFVSSLSPNGPRVLSTTPRICFLLEPSRASAINIWLGGVTGSTYHGASLWQALWQTFTSRALSVLFSTSYEGCWCCTRTGPSPSLFFFHPLSLSLSLSLYLSLYPSHSSSLSLYPSLSLSLTIPPSQAFTAD